MRNPVVFNTIATEREQYNKTSKQSKKIGDMQSFGNVLFHTHIFCNIRLPAIMYTPISIKVASVMHDAGSLFHRPQSIMFAISKYIEIFFFAEGAPEENQIMKNIHLLLL